MRDIGKLGGVVLFVGASVVPACTSAPAAPTPCTSSRDCSAAGLVCDIAASVCVECITNADCLAADRACRAHACVSVTPCTSSRMCPGQVCDLSAGFCVDCVADVDCTGGQTCEASVCVAAPTPCASDRECSAESRVCDTVRGVCVDCVRDADCTAGQSCTAGVCGAARPDAGSDAGSDAGIDAAPGPLDMGLVGDAGPRDVGVDAGTDAAIVLDAFVPPMDAGSCANIGASNACTTPTVIGPITPGGTLTSDVTWLPTGGATWYTITFPTTGGTIPRVDFASNDGGVYTFDVFTSCGAGSAACGAGETATALTQWEFNDGCIPSACHSTRSVAWPAQIWVRVTRSMASATCLQYQLRVTDPPSGCEASTIDHCGSTCADCTAWIRNATGATCRGGLGCDYSACTAGATDCDGMRANGCEVWSATACGASCVNCMAALPNTMATCSGGTCQWTSCVGGYANCDATNGNGCERMTLGTAADCCGVACVSPATCMGSPATGFSCR